MSKALKSLMHWICCKTPQGTYIVILLLLLTCYYPSFAQSRLSLHHFDKNVPQTNMLNPAIVPAYKVVVGLPVMSGIHIGFNNSGISSKDIFQYDKLKNIEFNNLQLDSARLMKKVGRQHRLTLDAEIQLFYFGLRIKKHHFSLGLHTILNTYISVPGQMITWPLTQTFTSLTFDPPVSLPLNRINARVMAYNQASVSYAYTISDKITAGIRAKYLMGIASAELMPLKGNIYLSPDSLHLDASAAQAYTSGQEDIEGILQNGLTVNTILNKMFNTDNWGLSFDLGVQYQINDRLSLAASAINLGFITWRKNVHAYKTNEGSLGVKRNFTSRREVTATINAFESVFDFKECTGQKFTTNLATQIYLNASYRVYKQHTVRMLGYMDIFRGNVNPAIGIAYNAPVGNFMSTTLGLSYRNGYPLNFSVGLAIRLGPVQLYTSTDRFNWIFEPEYLPQGNIQAGVNLVFNKRKKKKRKVVEDSVVVEEPPKPEPVEKDTVEEVKEPEVSPPPLPKPVIKQTPQPTPTTPVQGTYYVIVGAFETLENAQQHGRELDNIGYKSYVEQLTDKNLYYVYLYKISNDKQAARQKLYELWNRDDRFASAWVLSVLDEE